MEQFTNNMVAQAQAYGPSIIKALLVFILFVIGAYVVRWLISTAIDKTGLAKSANETNTTSLDTPSRKTIGQSLASAAFWIVILIGLMQAFAIAGATQFSSTLDSVLQPIMFYLPRIVGAVIIFGLFILVAKIVKTASRAILGFTDSMPARFGITDGPVNISGSVAYIASAIVVILGGITALDTLNIEAISGPATALLEDIVAIIPNLIAAVLIIGIFVFIAKFVGGLISRVLPSLGLDKAMADSGLLSEADSGLTATSIVSRVSQFMIVLLGLVAGLSALGIDALSNAMDVILAIGSQIIFGSVIIFAGVYIARLVSKAMASTSDGTMDVAASLAKWVITILAVILGVSRMGLDPSADGSFVLDAARILLIGATATAVIGFGWGGRDWFAARLEEWTPSKPAAKAKAKAKSVTPRATTASRKPRAK